ncbi:MAG TPA: 50S ribosomal protein L10 [Myxococcales bacterium]|nr:50S ribosomal protein L10 [Myxococcales bacterium]
MLTREQKKEAVSELGDKFARATSVFVADFRGLSVEDVRELRGLLRSEPEDDFEYRVAKNSLLALAADGHDAEVLKEHFSGPTAVALSYGDPVGLAKVLVKYSKDHELFEIKGGVLDGKPLNEGEVKHLATLPNLLELRGKLVGLLQAPAVQLARLFNEPGGQLARLVAARKDALEE